MCEIVNTEAQIFRERLAAIFGKGAQTSFARFLALAGDHRSHNTILRSINAAANGERTIPGKLLALLSMIERPEEIAERIKVARREPEPPMFQLIPLPSAQQRG